MDGKEYIESGLVLDYCLGIMRGQDKISFEQAMRQFPDLELEVKQILSGLDKYASAYAKSVPAAAKDKIMATLENLLLEKEMDLNRLPIINQYSDRDSWFAAVKHLLPKEKPEGNFMHVLTHTDTVMQVLIMTGGDVPDEVHDDCYESFIILEGECECHIGDHTVVRLKAGGYMAIPLHEHHDLKIISDYVVGVMQRIAA